MHCQLRIIKLLVIRGVISILNMSSFLVF